METYSTWDSVPEHLKTKTKWKEAGRRVKRGRKPAAKKVGGYGPYDLYHEQDTVENKLSEKQKAAIAKAQAASKAKRTCERCGYVEPLGGWCDWRQVKDNLCTFCQNDAFLEKSRKEAREWAKSVLADSGVLILDTETTDLDGEIIELAMIDAGGETIYNGRFNPLSEVSDGALEIHGIHNGMLQNEPSWSDEWPKIQGLIQSASRLVIYNSQFDVARIHHTCHLHNVGFKPFSHQCAMLEYAAFVGEWNDYYQNFQWQRLPSGDHTALGDCKATFGSDQEDGK